MEFWCFELIDIDAVARRSLKAVELCGSFEALAATKSPPVGSNSNQSNQRITFEFPVMQSCNARFNSMFQQLIAKVLGYRKSKPLGFPENSLPRCRCQYTRRLGEFIYALPSLPLCLLLAVGRDMRARCAAIIFWRSGGCSPVIGIPETGEDKRIMGEEGPNGFDGKPG